MKKRERRLVAAGWPSETPALVVSRAGWPDRIASEHVVATLGDATVLHAGRPTVVTVGVGAAPVQADRAATAPSRAVATPLAEKATPTP